MAACRAASWSRPRRCGRAAHDRPPPRIRVPVRDRSGVGSGPAGPLRAARRPAREAGPAHGTRREGGPPRVRMWPAGADLRRQLADRCRDGADAGPRRPDPLAGRPSRRPDRRRDLRGNRDRRARRVCARRDQPRPERRAQGVVMSPPPTSTPPRDRRARLEAVGTLNGIDFVEIANDAETLLRIQFLTTTPDATALAAAITGATVTGGQSIATVEVQPPSSWSWSTAPSGRPVVDMSVAAPGDFSTYTLTLLTNAEVLDRYYDHVAFSFKAGCVSTTDCEPKPPPPGQVEGGAPPIDYLAKDFDSFRRALSEFSTRRYPAWQERSEADFGVMFMEALASLADDLSYQQDRIAAEAWLDTATERRSLVQLARLVDYEPAVAAVASTMLQFQMATPGTIPAGVLVSAYAPDGSFVEFETGTGLADQQSYDVHPAWNDLACHWFDDEQRCVPKGATSLYVIRPGAPLRTGQALLVEEAPLTPADPPRRTIVRLAEDAVDDIDPLFGSGPGPTPLARLTWRAEDALPFGVDLARTTLRGNLVPATDGRRHSERFTTTTAWSRLASRTRATVRTGPNG